MVVVFYSEIQVCVYIAVCVGKVLVRSSLVLTSDRRGLLGHVEWSLRESHTNTVQDLTEIQIQDIKPASYHSMTMLFNIHTSKLPILRAISVFY